MTWRYFLAGVLLFGLAATPDNAWAQAESGTAAHSGTRLITLGTRSGPRPTPVRAQSSNVLIVNGTLYLIDAGAGVTRRLVRAGIRIADVARIFITHPHDDHTGGLPALLTSEYSSGRTEPIEIYGPAGVQALADGMIHFLTVSSEIRMSDGNRTIPVAQIIAAREVGTGTVYRDENVTVTAVENSHFNFQPGSPAYGKYKSYSYRFDTPDRSIVFTGDTGPSEAVTQLAMGVDLLVTEVTFANADEVREQRIRTGAWQTMTPQEQAGYLRHMVEEHLTQEEVGRMAARAGVGTVLLTHLPNTDDPGEDYASFRAAVAAQFSGTVLLAEDLGEY